MVMIEPGPIPSGGGSVMSYPGISRAGRGMARSHTSVGLNVGTINVGIAVNEEAEQGLHIIG